MTLSLNVQRDIIRRTLMGSAGAWMYTLVTLFGFQLGYVRIAGELLVIGLGIYWLGHLAMLGLFIRGRTRHLDDPALVLYQMVWAIITVTLVLYHAMEIRAAFMMAYLSILPFGAFRLGWRGFFGISVFTLACYLGALILLQHNQTIERWDAQIEVLVGLTFLIAMLGYSILGREFSRLREMLIDSNHQLRLALIKIEELAIRDELTGLYNRRYLENALEKQSAQANRDATPFVLAFIDLDHFKVINDEHGHPVGDQVLVEFSELLQQSVREVDTVSRFGGEEFVILASGVGIESANVLFERILQKVAVTPFANNKVALTISIGLTQYREAEEAAKLIQRADKLLYRAKALGRNQIVKASDEIEAMTESTEQAALLID